MKISIPFMARFNEPLKDGTKTVTRRTRKYGEKGDWFEHRHLHIKFVLTKEPFKEKLKMMNDAEARREGCQDLDDFIKVWKSIHYGRGFNPEWSVWVHEFERFEGEPPKQPQQNKLFPERSNHP